MKIKICGMNNLNNLQSLEELKPDYFGFIFYKKSPRNFSEFELPKLKYSRKVGVFVNEDIDTILKYQCKFQLEAIQLHGEESASFIKNLKEKLPNYTRIFKAISIKNRIDFLTIDTYKNVVDIVILDTKAKVKGGSGKKFDWELLKYYNFNIPYLLSGGIGAEDAVDIIELYKKHEKLIGVDINSKFELSPGIKNKSTVEHFINNIRSSEVNQ